MYPQLFEIPLPDWLPWLGGELTIYTYGLLLAAAYLAGLQLALVRARHRGLDANRVMDLGLWIIIAALVGAKLLLVITDFEYFVANPRDLVSIVRSGGVFYGGLILAVIVGLWYMRRHQLPTWTTCDVMAPGIALGHVVGRLGCFLAGCCYGKPTSAPWGVMFTDPFAHDNVGTPLGVHLHPTQLYEAGAELIILVVLLATERRRRPFAGRTFWLYMLLYGVSRFIIEFFRGDPRGMVAGLSTSQFISVILVPLSVVMLVRLSRRGPAPQPSRRRTQAKAA
ncbi:MAG: prolipoprotein diacylglyceryl transferase [Luteitalea sp.]|nr:prolipoprotein diacylglyceryl transferase [Luteitalea sp.]